MAFYIHYVVNGTIDSIEHRCCLHNARAIVEVSVAAPVVAILAAPDSCSLKISSRNSGL